MNTSAQTAVKHKKVTSKDMEHTSGNPLKHEIVFTPDFSHRCLGIAGHPDVDDIEEMIRYKIDTAIGMINLLATQFISDDSNNLDGESITCMTTVIDHEFNDHIAIAADFHQLSEFSDFYRKERKDSKEALPEWILTEGISTLTANLLVAIQHMAKRAGNATLIIDTVFEKSEKMDINNKVVYAALESIKEELIRIKTAVYEFSVQIELQT